LADEMSTAAGLVQLSGNEPRSACDGIQVARALALGTSVWIAFRSNLPEMARRSACGLGQVPGWDLLDTLMELPAGLPVPATALSRPALRLVRAAPAGVLRIAGDQVIRDLVPPVTPLLAIITSRDWSGGLARASRFAPYCRRLVIGPEISADSDVLRTAARLGIGVAVRGAESAAEVLLEPEPVNDWQPTTAWWRFCETVYGQAGAARA
jgi:hypothetical protein